MQSPKSKRSHGPGENPPNDNLPMSEQGGRVDRQGPAERGPQVPSLEFGGQGYKGGFEASTNPSSATSRPAPIPSGRAGYATDPEDAKRTGGNVERFANNRGGNS